ncbi:MAG: hypothetical protein HZC41_06700 [Chloroflexi bacterium]|nr:hypothetical protein [Chloroflexota bacterium]
MSNRATPFVVFGLTVVVFVAVGLIIGLLLNSGLALPLPSLNPLAGQVERRVLERDSSREYTVVIPSGAIPANGWPTLVAIHGVGQTGADVAEAFQDAATKAGVLVIAPTLPEIHSGSTEADYENARNVLLVLLEDLQTAMFQNPRLSMHFLGQVYFGAGEGGAFVNWLNTRGLDYLDSGFAMQMPLDAITVEALSAEAVNDAVQRTLKAYGGGA